MTQKNVRAGFLRDGILFSRVIGERADTIYRILSECSDNGEIALAMIILAAEAQKNRIQVHIPDTIKDLNKFLFGMSVVSGRSYHTVIT